MDAASRWPARLLDECEDTFSEADFQLLMAKVMACHPEVARALPPARTHQAVDREDHRHEPGGSVVGFSPDVDRAVWWAQ